MSILSRGANPPGGLLSLRERNEVRAKRLQIADPVLGVRASIPPSLRGFALSFLSSSICHSAKLTDLKPDWLELPISELELPMATSLAQSYAAQIFAPEIGTCPDVVGPR